MQKEEEVSLINVNDRTANPDSEQPCHPQQSCTFICVKSVSVGCMLTLLIFNTIYGITFPKDHPTCFKDQTFKATENINLWFAKNQSFKNAFLIISSFSQDLLALVLAAFWTVKGSSWRLVFATLMFYIFIFQIKVPEGYLWTNPGFPSIFVSYNHTNDFFFSSFIGITLILALEFHKLQQLTLTIISALLIVFQFFLTTALRGNYFIDLYASLLTAHYSFMLMDDLSKYLDEKGILSGDPLKEQKREKIAI